MKVLKGQQAQTAIEIAVFGAILIFALGAIVRSGVSRGNQQSAVLKTTRMALTMSYDNSASLENASRNTASLLVIEDRLTAGSNKYGPIDRNPTAMSGSGTHSANLFMPVDFGDVEDIALFDLFVNGQHFEFTTSAFKTISLFPGNCPLGQCMAQIWIDNPQLEDVEETVLPIPTSARYRKACTPCPETEPACMGEKIITPCANSGLCGGAGSPCSDCSATSFETYPVSGNVWDCAKLYSIIDNHPDIKEWCNGGSIPCPIACSTSAVPGCNLSAAERFDLDRNDLDSIAGDASVPAGQWERFSWQWSLVMGFKESDSTPPASNLTGVLGLVIINGLLVGEGINLDEGKNTRIDVDQDLKMEQVMSIYTTKFEAPGNAVKNLITGFDVRDYQDGDIDFTFNDSDGGTPWGFTKDISIYTKVNDGGPGGGTYLKINTGGGSTRTTSKKDAIDIIERVFKLSNDTGRLCDGGNPVLGSGIEACNNCHSPLNVMKTCMDTGSLFLFIRSRILDYHGHKWVTSTGSDPYVEFLSEYDD